ncbi:MAG: DoxX family protein [Acidobacteria bacterium]|nr:DoxX family protein [Acidobacteriota bacterium]
MPTPATPVSKASRRAGQILGGLLIVFLVFDGGIKLMPPQSVLELSAAMGIDAAFLAKIGVTLLCCTLLYAIPRTSVLGAILLTGYLGGATFVHASVGQPFYFPIVFGILLWAALFLRDRTIQGLIPVRR